MRRLLTAGVSALALFGFGAGVAGAGTIGQQQVSAQTTPAAAQVAQTETDEVIVYRSYVDLDGDFDGVIAGGYSADDLIGKEVRNAEGEVVGVISDLLIDGSNRVDFVVVDAGQYLGVGGKPIAMRVDDLSGDAMDDFLSTSMKNKDVEAAPKIERGELGWAVTRPHGAG